jgi:hypothetical protein
MANLSITSSCNRACSCCFARESYQGAPANGIHISASKFGEALDFLERSQITQARLLGGEPTLHPQFSDLVDMALKRQFDLLIFSNGFMTESALKALEDTPADKTRIVINMTDAETSEDGLSECQKGVFDRLGKRIVLGYNIYSPAAHFDFLVELNEEFDLAPGIRLGLAHPRVHGANTYLYPRHYRPVGDKIVQFSERARSAGIALELDCGFVPCMFSEEGMGVLGEAGVEIGKRCNPIPDILPDGQVVACYPLSALCSMRLSPNDNATSLRRMLEEKIRPYRQIGIYRECSSCQLFVEERCNGGCLSAAMKRLQSSEGVLLKRRK